MQIHNLVKENPLLMPAREGRLLPIRTVADRTGKWYAWIVLVMSILMPVMAQLAALPFVGLYFLFKSVLPQGGGAFSFLPDTFLYLLVLIFGFAPIFLLIWGWLAIFEKRSLATTGLWGRNWLIKYLKGFGWGLAMMVAAVAIPAILGMVERQGSALWWEGFLGALIILPGWLVQGAAEEVLFRGFLLPVLANRWGIGAGVAVSSVVFAILHGLNPNLSILAMVNLCLYGVFAALFALRQSGLWGICALHSAWNWMQGHVLGLAVSGAGFGTTSVLSLREAGPDWLTGGAFGPEGGLAVTVILLVGIGTILFLPKMRRELTNKILS